MTKTYARVEAGAVAELLRTEANPAELFHPSLRWVPAHEPAVAVGWVEGPTGLAPRPPAPAQAPQGEPPPTLADLYARVVDLEAKVSALTPR
jgi:hypothetical protein